MKPGFNKRKSPNSEPINFYYQFKAPDADSEISAESRAKIKVLTKGQQIEGTYEHTFVRAQSPEEVAQGQKPQQTHVIRTEAEGKVTIKGCKSINEGLAGLKPGTPVIIVFLGKGAKPKKPGRKAPYLFDVYDAPMPVAAQGDEDELNETVPNEDDEDSEDDSALDV